MKDLNVTIVVGARPNFVKASPLVKVIKKAKIEGKNVDYKLVYTGSEDDSTLEMSLFSDLEISKPDVFLGVDCQNLNELTGRVMSEFDKYLEHNPTDIVIVVDDLASTMAVAIVTKKRGCKLAHVVAGTRSFDIRMPKEVNRLVIDGLSDLLFTASLSGNSIVNRENTQSTNVYMVGNILMDTLRFSKKKMVRPLVMDELYLKEKDYLVFTLNGKTLLNDKESLENIISSIVFSSSNVTIVAPLRKEAQTVISSLVIKYDNFKIIDSLSYLEFGYLTSNAMGIITDSNNLAEEATFNNVPCATLSKFAEHIETVTYGSNVLVGEDAQKLSLAVNDMVKGNWKRSTLPDSWDGHTAERILQILLTMNYS